MDAAIGGSNGAVFGELFGIETRILTRYDADFGRSPASVRPESICPGELSTMPKNEIEAIARVLMTQHQNRETLVPLHDRIADDAMAYDVKDAFVALQIKSSGAVMKGYKIGLTAKSIQQVMKTTEPTEGEVLSHRVQTSPHRVRLSDFNHLGLESEICVVLAKDLAADCTPADVRAALGTVHASYELIDDRNADYSKMNALTLIADNSWNAAVVMGAATSAAQVPAYLKATLSCNGEVLHESNPDGLKEAIEMVIWLARHLGKRGKQLKAGLLVMTGNIMPTKFPKAGETYTFAVQGLAPVELNIVA
jgi:2-keto-4-pentenoate hydratase